MIARKLRPIINFQTMNKHFSLFITCIFLLGMNPSLAYANSTQQQTATTINKSHAIAMHGDIKYPETFKHFDYAEPQAIKGGKLKLASQGTFDTLNGFIAKGTAADQLGLNYDSLTVASSDEAFTQYGLVAKRIIWPSDRSYVEYQLRPEAAFHDGHPITAEDIKFSFELLMDKGHPYFQSSYDAVDSVSIINAHHVRFNFKNNDNAELPLIIGQLPILPAHATNTEDFDKSSLSVPLGSGPYKISQVEPGKRLVFSRVEDYWAKDLAVNKGRYNYNEIQVDYYRDATVMLEALKAGEYDFRYERVSKLWATAYEGQAINDGKLLKKQIPHQNPVGMQAFLMNLRNPLFSDIRVRKALNYAFDFEWTNQQLFYNAYKRSYSFFSNSELASRDLPSDAELKLLNPLRKDLPETVFKQAFTLPVTKGDGRNRLQLRKAKQLLESAGWTVKNNLLVNAQGEQFKFEFLTFDPAFERIINPFIKGLAKLGIQASIRKVEVSQYINRLRKFDYDVITSSYPQSLSPGIEQHGFWHSSQADITASRNLLGIKSPAIDALVSHVAQAKSRDALVTASRALDRALLHNWYVIPQWYIDSHRIAHWDKFATPKTAPPYDSAFSATLMTWWIDSQKADALR